MAGHVLSDASPLIALVQVIGLIWLQRLFGTVHVPPEVLAEVASGRGFAGEAEVLKAVHAGWLKVTGPAPATPELPELDEGETACIRLGLSVVTKAGAGQSSGVLILMDERAGRAVAQEHGLRVAGTAAVIGMAKSQGLIVSAKDVFSRLHASDFRISTAVISTVLKRVGE